MRICYEEIQHRSNAFIAISKNLSTMKRFFQKQKAWKKKISFTAAVLAIGMSAHAQWFTPSGVTPAVITSNTPVVVHGAASGNGTGIALSFGGGGIYIGKGAGASATQTGYNIAIGNAVSHTTPLTFDQIPLASLSATSSTGPFSANYNLAIGNSALRSITTSNFNTALGQFGVMYNLTSGDGNTAIGAATMGTITTGSNNTALGYNALSLVNGGSNNLGLGAGANVQTASASYQLSIQNVIYGSNMSTAAAGNIGIGLTPAATASGTWSKLQIGGSAAMPSLRLSNVPTASVLSGRSYLFVDADGIVTQAQIPAGGTTTHTLTNPANTITSTVNGVAATAPAVNTVVNTYNNTNNTLTTTVNGVASTAVTLGTGNINIYNSNGVITAGVGTRIVDMNNNNLWFNTVNSSTNGRIYIGNATSFPTSTGNYRLYVEGGVLTEKVKVALRSSANWADYVFDKDYKLMPLKNVEAFIKTNKHLPGIIAANDLAKEGLDLGEMQAKQMEKIEELTLYIIEQNKNLEKQQAKINELKATVETLLKKIK